MNLPFALVIFGATGDLVQKKLIPVLFSLFKNKKLPEDFYVIGVARREFSNQDFANLFTELTKDNEFKKFSEHLIYHTASFEDKEKYKSLADFLDTLDSKSKKHLSRIFYLATPPKNYETILDFLSLYQKELSQKLEQDGKYGKLAIEKPFGKDIVTAQMLDKKLADDFSNWQIFRVDHYLGKETLQNMLVFRFANSIFEPVWNYQFIDHVQIHWSEEKGIDNRGNFWEGVGLLRDFAQNHLMQLFAAVAMDMPKSFSKEGVRDARAKAIASINCLNPIEVEKSVVRAQYNGYKNEKDVLIDSKTETFIAMKFTTNNPRFLGVPFYVKAGKALGENRVSVSVVFKQTCHILFKEIGCPEEGNALTFNIQPKEGITLSMISKKPGTTLALQNAGMHFSYKEQFNTQGSDAYEKILLDIFMGDQMLFNRSDELESSWKFVASIVEGWEKLNVPVFEYSKNSNGPSEAQDLIEKDGRKWI